jgi:preprotein translocase subunit SecY
MACLAVHSFSSDDKGDLYTVPHVRSRQEGERVFKAATHVVTFFFFFSESYSVVLILRRFRQNNVHPS